MFPDRSVPDSTERVADQDFMWRALATLPAKQRAVLVLRHYEDMTDSDIAAALDCQPSTVRSQAARALETLRSRPGWTRGRCWPVRRRTTMDDLELLVRETLHAHLQEAPYADRLMGDVLSRETRERRHRVAGGLLVATVLRGRRDGHVERLKPGRHPD